MTKVMGILNMTPDSSSDGGKHKEDALEFALGMVDAGADIIDIGGESTRPGATPVDADEEIRRIIPIIKELSSVSDVKISVDTMKTEVAAKALDAGADIINDVSEGGITGIVDKPLEERYDVDAETDDKYKDYPAIFRMMGRLKVPYILMSVQGNLHDMLMNFSKEVQQLRDLHVKDIILDPGYGFGKTQEENFAILHEQRKLEVMGLPILAGLSRKRLIWKTLDITADEALNGTTVVNVMALLNGASILRVHDVREAVQATKLVKAYNTSLTPNT